MGFVFNRGNITNGSIINADDLAAQFEAVAVAINATELALSNTKAVIGQQNETFTTNAIANAFVEVNGGSF